MINAIPTFCYGWRLSHQSTEKNMHFLKSLAAAGIMTVGALGFAGGSASASPLMPVIGSSAGHELVSTVQYYEGRPRRVAPPVYRRAGPPPYRYGYRPVRRTVCRTVVRPVRTPAGFIVRRPVEVCRTR
jgi:hypothetical protein